MTRYSNSAKNSFLASIPTASIDLESDRLAARCKFNFSYFEVQAPGKDFSDLENTTLVNLVTKLKEYGRESLEYWSTQPVGKSGTVFSVYGAFPSKSDFTHPRHVPHQAEWARFRLDWATRLCGFTIPKGYNGRIHKGSGQTFCSNTFYVVFFDPDHRFYRGSDKNK